MKQKVLITITGYHNYSDDEEPVEAAVYGTYFSGAGASYLVYTDESDDGTGEECRIKITRNSLELVRLSDSGAVRMTFDTENECETVYPTPMGDLSMTISRVRINRHEEDADTPVNVEISYVMGLNDTVRSDSKLTVKAELCPV